MRLVRSATNALWRAVGDRPKTPATRPYLAAAVGAGCALALYLGAGQNFVSLAWDPHEVNCLPELHLALLVHTEPGKIQKGDYLFWRAAGSLSYVKEQFVLKKVAGIPGDRLDIRDGQVRINGDVVAEGFENAVLYKKTAAQFERGGTIPPDSYFVIGTARMSNDSRYWGYLTAERIVGKGYRIY